MKFFYLLILLIFLSNCSFDDKSGIWKNESNFPQDIDKNVFKEFRKLSLTNEQFDKIINIKDDYTFKLPKKVVSKNWSEELFNESNNAPNLAYNDLNKLTFKTSKITKNKVRDYILSQNNLIILSDLKGNLIIFSLNESKIIQKFNFYQKKYKNIKKVLNLIVEDNIIYVSDNLGYLYALNYTTRKVEWAKNYKTPFRSNLKIAGNKLVAATENNNLYFFDKSNGNILKLIPTEENIIQNEFVNNLSSNRKFTYFINSYGSLYAINNYDMTIKWFLNLKQSVDTNTSNLFEGSKIINFKDKIVVSSNNFTHIIDANNGSILFKVNFSTSLKPLLINNYLFMISKNDLLIAFDLNKGELIYSVDVNQNVADFLKSKKKKLIFKNIFMINDQINVFLKNSYVLKFNVNGSLKEVVKLPTKILTEPILVNRSILYLDKKNKLSVVN